MKDVIKKWNSTSLVLRIIAGLIVGIILALIAPEKLSGIGILGDLFVGALKGIAPLLVFFLVMEAITKHKDGQKTNMTHIIFLYLIGTFAAAVVAVFVSFAFPTELTLAEAPAGFEAPKGLVEILQALLLRVVANPLEAIATANYIGVLAWAVVIALAIKNVVKKEAAVSVISTTAQALGQVVRWVISLAPFGIMGLVFNSIATSGLDTLLSYGQLILVLVGTMLIVALVVNPIIAFIGMRKNPYPLVFKCLKDSGLTAFFTRSSAANIPVNMELCEELGLDEDTYAISIPLGATINMAGAAITITVLTLAAAYTAGVEVSIGQAIFLSFLAALSACGASGVAGGSLLLIPLACSLFNIPQDYAMQVVGVGFIVGVIQDSCETALNSSTDVLFTAVADYANKRKANKI
ncbi:MAG: serine/threonine transporter SstT [Bacilli bacterium]